MHAAPQGPSLPETAPRPAMLWKPVPDFVDYQVSEYGDVRKGFSLLTPERVQGSQRKRFTLSKGGRKYRFHAAKLVALAFIGPKPFEKAEVCHRDGFKHNNHYSNLRWDTKANNSVDAMELRLKLSRKTSARDRARGQLAVEASRILANS